jgi:oxygen-independent coproporphyrinogen-3 oxidase
MTDHSGPLGLYIHIPFCSRLCHYCDFVKTARYNQDLQSAYLRALEARARTWLEFWPELFPEEKRLESVFFGGGTPSLLDREYEPLVMSFKSRLSPSSEVSLEANPEHITEDRLKIWASLGINRLSLGVQSFQNEGLKRLTREHTPEQAAEAVSLARNTFSNVNIDLIYGWPGQTEAQWEADLEQAIALGAEHLSLYTLTYEGRTPMARRVQRGVLEPSSDASLESFYRLACAQLSAAGYLHEEVSNWAKPAARSRHNAIYWNGGSYIGLGSGAHSYLEHWGRWGLRWQQHPSWKRFAETPEVSVQSISELLSHPDYHQETDRDAQAWILEGVSSALRTQRGLNLDAICAKTGYILNPRPAVRQAMDLGLLRVDAQGQLTLSEAEWYRETYWSLEVSLSLKKA